MTVKWWQFGALNMLKRIDADYRGFHVSRYNVLHDGQRLLFQHSWCWRAINELQSCCNLYCALPFWRESLRNSWSRCISSLFWSFNGLRAQSGNAIVFKKNHQIFRSYIALKNRRCSSNPATALRALYIMRDDAMDSVADSPYDRRLSTAVMAKKEKKRKRKKLWIVCTQLAEGDGDGDDLRLSQLRQTVEWMEKAQRKICRADAIVIVGDFNATPQSELYQMMADHGYRSAVLRRLGKEQWTFPTETWRHGNPEVVTKRTTDYVWIKSSCPVRIEKVQLVGRHYIDSEHRGQKIKIYPSDHLGIYVKLAI